MSYSRPPPRIEGMVSLKVDNLTYRTTPEDLRRVFERCGEVGDIYIPRDRFTRESRGFAFVRYVVSMRCVEHFYFTYGLQKWLQYYYWARYKTIVRKVELPHILGRGSLWWQYAVIQNFDLIWFAMSYNILRFITGLNRSYILVICIGFMINVMLKMHWTQWMVACWMVGSYVYKWLVMDVLLHLIEDVAEGTIFHYIIMLLSAFYSSVVFILFKTKQAANWNDPMLSLSISPLCYFMLRVYMQIYLYLLDLSMNILPTIDF